MVRNRHNEFGGINMKRKLVYLPNEYSKDIVDNINGYFDKGYEIEDIFNANEGIYILLVLKDNENYKYVKNFDLSDCRYPLIEEKKEDIQTWVTSNTKQVKTN
jgi:hypothetical protein